MRKQVFSSVTNNLKQYANDAEVFEKSLFFHIFFDDCNEHDTCKGSTHQNSGDEDIWMEIQAERFLRVKWEFLINWESIE